MGIDKLKKSLFGSDDKDEDIDEEDCLFVIEIKLGDE